MRFKVMESGKTYELVVESQSGEDFTGDYVANLMVEHGDFAGKFDGVYHIGGVNFEWLLETARADAEANEELGINEFTVYTDYN